MNYHELNMKQLLDLCNEEPDNKAAFEALLTGVEAKPEALMAIDDAAEDDLTDKMWDIMSMENDFDEEDMIAEELGKRHTTRGLDSMAVIKDPPVANARHQLAHLQLDTRRNERWNNWVGTERLIPDYTCYPKSLAELQALVVRAEAEDKNIRAFGSGHSISDVAVCDHYIVNTSCLDQVLPLQEELLKPGATSNQHLFAVEAGIKIWQLNTELEHRKLALLNMGGSTVQSLAGAVSTSTHGSGIDLGPFSSFVRSLILVSTGGKVYRIEPTNGITNPDKWDVQNIELVQDDDHFNSVLVSMGCMGIIYSMIIEVSKAYLLTEEREQSKWTDVKRVINTLGLRKQLDKYRHLEFIINPHETNGDHTTIITKRSIATTANIPHGRPGKRNCLPSLLAGWKFMPKVFIKLFNLTPKKTPVYLDGSLLRLDDDEFTNKSYEVLNQGTKQLKFIAGAVELGFPIEQTVEAVEKIFEFCERNVRVHGRYLTAPFGVRFVQQSNAYLSMMYGRDTCMIEIPAIIKTKEWRDLLIDLEEELMELGGRPHWGLNMKFQGDAVFDFEQIYPRFATWRQVYMHYNSRGTFDNKFTKRFAFSMQD